jgi:alpha-amylase
MLKRLLLIACIFSVTFSFSQNPWNGKVVIQGFWWDYWNNNHPNAWANYLTELSPRMRDMGIDAVWIPPTIKNAGTNKVGYSPFDHYDLGDKFQKGSVTTRFGNKDQFLRMVAVYHANGIGVIQDVVLNHASDAGNANGAGGQDPEPNYSMKSENGYKNFRYASWSTPVPSSSVPGNTAAENATEYYGRSGRWSKNYTNFHPNQWTNTTSGNWAQGGWGPDLSYEDGRSYGPSTNATVFNPAQYNNYSLTEARNWMVWLKKQTGVDGFRWDAVKHFPHWVVQDLSWNVKYNAGWANGGAQMFNVGEYVGSSTEMDTYINDVKFSNGGSEDLVGTFDFSLREGLYGIVTGGGFYDLGTIPGKQQGNRYRTVPFVNNHDTFRPNGFNASGDYTSWDTGNELAPHINPDDPRIQVCYAIAMAVDGSPQIFFEDLFDLSTTTRYTHAATSTADLPVRSYLQNLIWCHQKLNFKQGSYIVRWQAGDALVIERSNRALIGVNDTWNTWQQVTVQTNFGANRQLHDYSGANANDIWTNGSGQATFWIPPCDGSNTRRGYCVWGPSGISGGFAPPTNSTTQEWEMANDLGDSHLSSLRQGGALPSGSTALRTVGKVFSNANNTITVNVFPTLTGVNAKNLQVNIYNSSGSIMTSINGTSNPLTLSYTPASTGFYTVKVKNYSSSNPSQKVFVKVNYTAPRVVNTATSGFTSEAAKGGEGMETGEMLKETEEVSVSVHAYPNPFSDKALIIFTLPEETKVKLEVFNSMSQSEGLLENGILEPGEYTREFSGQGKSSGVYLYKLTTDKGIFTGKVVLQK